ncbi:MAG: hypothetical protein WB729_25210 [Candidatus Sulfotelmatobacter sp.]
MWCNFTFAAPEGAISFSSLRMREQAAEKAFLPANSKPQALKRVSDFKTLAARVNSCPSRPNYELIIFPQPVKENTDTNDVLLTLH